MHILHCYSVSYGQWWWPSCFLHPFVVIFLSSFSNPTSRPNIFSRQIDPAASGCGCQVLAEIHSPCDQTLVPLVTFSCLCPACFCIAGWRLGTHCCIYPHQHLHCLRASSSLFSLLLQLCSWSAGCRPSSPCILFHSSALALASSLT